MSDPCEDIGRSHFYQIQLRDLLLTQANPISRSWSHYRYNTYVVAQMIQNLSHHTSTRTFFLVLSCRQLRRRVKVLFCPYGPALALRLQHKQKIRVLANSNKLIIVVFHFLPIATQPSKLPKKQGPFRALRTVTRALLNLHLDFPLPTLQPVFRLPVHRGMGCLEL